MNGTSTRRAIAARRPASSPAWLSLSMTQGPAMRTSGRPPPMAISPIVTGFTGTIIEGRKGDAALSHLKRDRLVRVALYGVRLVLVRRLDKARKERMRPRRLRLEFRVELNREVPRVARQLGNLHELAVGRPAGDAQT